MTNCTSVTVQDITSVLGTVDDKKIDLNAHFFKQLAENNPRLEKDDFISFIHKCVLSGADPRKDQVYLIPREVGYKLPNGQWAPDKKVKGTVVFAYQFFIARAHATGLLDGFEVESTIDEYTCPSTGKNKKSITAKATVYRKDQRYPVTYKARFWEFAGMDRRGQLSPQWASKPYLMIEKCAIANAMRLAFPDQMSGMYTREEMSHEQNEPINITPIKEESKPDVVEAETPKRSEVQYVNAMRYLKEITKGDEHRKKYVFSELNGQVDFKHDPQDSQYWDKVLSRVTQIKSEQVDQAVGDDADDEQGTE